MSTPLSRNTLETLFLQARSYNSWRPQDIPRATLQQIFDVAKWGPTSANCSPGRFLFLTSEAAKLRLSQHAS